jgi:hypothetical protein
MLEEFLSELVEAISNWPEVVTIAEGGISKSGAIKIKPRFVGEPGR